MTPKIGDACVFVQDGISHAALVIHVHGEDSINLVYVDPDFANDNGNEINYMSSVRRTAPDDEGHFIHPC